MNLLGIETSGAIGSVALRTADGVLVREQSVASALEAVAPDAAAKAALPLRFLR